MSTDLHGEAQMNVEVSQTRNAIASILTRQAQPSARELLSELERRLGSRVRFTLRSALEALLQSSNLTRAQREYLVSLIDSKDLNSAINGDCLPDKDILSSIDSLLAKSRLYKNSGAFKELVRFMGAFKEYAPYNNMLVRLQNPSCAFYATEKDWLSQFQRTLKEAARPMLILAPKHPVLLVYDLDQTEGPSLPAELKSFARFEGDWNSIWLENLISNAQNRDQIDVAFIELSSTHAGYASEALGTRSWKRRVRIHQGLDAPSRFGVLCHELAHILLGHLGGDRDGWWPSRLNLDKATKEIEAEAVAFIVTERLGLRGASASYVSRFLGDEPIPESVSLDYIAKVAGRLEKMARSKMSPRRSKPPGSRAANSVAALDDSDD